ncbi:MAG: nicotinate (nicotinamide) nucleotide adenylyltransferase [Elusimicrobia bacterium]|nr:nicotinate (nicotinamide) nucleotide adenylyltransferase [Elusimicrobiota bacterium]
MKLGLFGGSFDPVHCGHIALARAALRELKLDRIYFVPAAQPPHKTPSSLTPATHRLNMLRIALRNAPAFPVSPWEIRRGGVSYTERTLRAFHKRFPRAEWHLILGGDSLNSFTTWRHWRRLLKMSRLVVGRRPGAKSAATPSVLKGQVIRLKTRLPPISSTEVRRRLEKGRPVAPLLPLPVGRYIRQMNLYGQK